MTPEDYKSKREEFELEAVQFWLERSELLAPIEEMLKEKYGMEYTVGGYEYEEDIVADYDRWGTYLSMPVSEAEGRLNES